MWHEADEVGEAPPGGPYIAAAFLCERILDEKDGVLSAIRIIDRFLVSVHGPLGVVPTELPPRVLSFVLLLSFRSGAARGRHTVTLRPEKPSGQRMDETSFPVLFEGEDRGANLILPTEFEVNEEGLYWFDVLVDGRLMTRIPMRVLYQPIASGTSGGG